MIIIYIYVMQHNYNMYGITICIYNYVIYIELQYVYIIMLYV